MRFYHLRPILIYMLAIFVAIPSSAANIDEDSLLNMLHEEVELHYAKFLTGKAPANYVGVSVNKVRTFNIKSILGVTAFNNSDMNTQFSVNVKVGTTESNSSSFRPGLIIHNNSFTSSDIAEYDINKLRSAISVNLDAMYDKASKNKRNIKICSDNNKDLCFYSSPAPSKYIEALQLESNINTKDWENTLNEVCSLFRTNNYCITASIELNTKLERIVYVSSDGAEIAKNKSLFTITILTDIINSKSIKCPLSKTIEVRNIEDLPTKEELKQTANEMLKILKQLYEAPNMESLDGPVLFGGKATGVIMHEILGHDLESRSFEISSMMKNMNKRLLPDFIQISDNPLIDRYANKPLVGYYLYDDEGVKSRNVECIKNGVLTSLLTSRSPYFERSASNGHGRNDFLNETMARQANLFVSSSTPCSNQQLREMFINQIKKQNKEYGYFIPEIVSGSTQAADPLRYKAQNDSSIIFLTTTDYAYKIFGDGRPDQLVKGSKLSSSTKELKRSIVALGKECEVLNGICGAKSGDVPVSLIAPDMLVERIKLILPKTSKNVERMLNMPAIPDLKFKDESSTILNALTDEMSVVIDKMKKGEMSDVCFADYILKNKNNCYYIYSDGKCTESNENKKVQANLRLYQGDKHDVTEVSGSLYDMGVSLPFFNDYFVIRNIMREKTIAAYNKMLKQNSKKADMSKHNILLREFPAAELIDDQNSCCLDTNQLRDISYKLSMELSKHHGVKNSSVYVNLAKFNNYRVTSEAQRIYKQQINLYILSHMDVIQKDGSSKHKTFYITFMDIEPSRVIKAFKKKVNDELKYLKNFTHDIEPDSSYIYDGPILVEGESVKSILSKKLDNCLVDMYMPKGTFAIGDTVLDTRLSICQKADLPIYKGSRLQGYEQYDMDGVKTESVSLIENGLLRNKLSGRLSNGASTHSTGNERIRGYRTMIAIGVIHVTSSKTNKYRSIKSEFIRKARDEGHKYAYILRKDEYENEESLYRVDVDTREEARVKCDFNVTSKSSTLVAASKEEYIVQGTQDRDSSPFSIILPRAMLFEGVKIQIIGNENKN